MKILKIKKNKFLYTKKKSKSENNSQLKNKNIFFFNEICIKKICYKYTKYFQNTKSVKTRLCFCCKNRLTKKIYVKIYKFKNIKLFLHNVQICHAKRNGDIISKELFFSSECSFETLSLSRYEQFFNNKYDNEISKENSSRKENSISSEYNLCFSGNIKPNNDFCESLYNCSKTSQCVNETINKNETFFHNRGNSPDPSW